MKKLWGDRTFLDPKLFNLDFAYFSSCLYTMMIFGFQVFGFQRTLRTRNISVHNIKLQIRHYTTSDNPIINRPKTRRGVFFCARFLRPIFQFHQLPSPHSCSCRSCSHHFSWNHIFRTGQVPGKIWFVKQLKHQDQLHEAQQQRRNDT